VRIRVVCYRWFSWPLALIELPDDFPHEIGQLVVVGPTELRPALLDQLVIRFSRSHHASRGLSLGRQIFRPAAPAWGTVKQIAQALGVQLEELAALAEEQED
jgi:hypothetical protein